MFSLFYEGLHRYIADRPERSLPTWASAHSAKDSDTAVRVRDRHLTPLQLTTDQGWSEPPGTPDGNGCLGLTRSIKA